MKITSWIKVICFLIISFTIHFFSCAHPVNKEDVNDPINKYKVYLMGKVVNKNGDPVSYAIAHLKMYNVFDTTDNNGIYEIKVDLDDFTKTEKTVTDTSDTLLILKEGQIITSIEIINFIDTLPDLMIVQRNIGGTIASTVTQFSRIEAIVWNHSDLVIKSATLEYSLPTFSYSGFIYFVYKGITQNYSLYVNVYNIDSLFIGRSDTISFSSLAGDVQIPLLDPTNAIPVPVASADSAVSINDTLYLKGTASDRFGGTIVKWEWDAGNTGTFVETTPDSNYTSIAPSTSDTAYPCVLKVTDNDGNSALDTVTVNVLTDAPIPTASTTTPTVSINDTIRLQGTATDEYGKIMKWEWDAGNTGTFTEATPESSFTVIAPTSSEPIGYQCVLKVTDDDDNEAKDTITIYVSISLIDIDGNEYHSVKIGNQVWTIENLRTTKYNDGTLIPLVTDNSAWASLSTPGYCWYDNNEANKNTYGALYNWYTIETRKLAPTGWHVANDNDWRTLITYLGGFDIAGGKMKEVGFTHWTSPNIDATNEYGFSGLPGGVRYNDGNFFHLGNKGHWWSGTGDGGSTAYQLGIYYNFPNCSMDPCTYGYGFSVRLVRD